jgi:hypothetical protein
MGGGDEAAATEAPMPTVDGAMFSSAGNNSYGSMFSGPADLALQRKLEKDAK